MVGELFAGLGAFKTMFDMTKAVQNAHDVATRDRAVIELQKEILTAQMQQATLVERIRELETQVAGFEKWDAEKDRYALTDFGGHSFAYSVKPEAANGEPPHRICPNCYEKRQKAILQFRFNAASGRERWICNGCKTEFEFGHPAPPRNHSAAPWRR